jgi:hypothetical protein
MWRRREYTTTGLLSISPDVSLCVLCVKLFRQVQEDFNTEGTENTEKEIGYF